MTHAVMTHGQEVDTQKENEEARGLGDVSVGELDQMLEQAIRANERSERLICEYLVEMNQREGHKEFGYSDIWDYAEFRFGFSERKTRYLMELGRKLKRLPKLRAAMAEGRIGWSKASKVARVAQPEDEAMWVDSALSLSARALERKIRADSEDVGCKVRVWLSDDQAAVWNQAVEVCRKMAGRQMYEGNCLELIAAEFLATYASMAYQSDQCEPVIEEQATEEELEKENETLSAEEEGAASEELAGICPEDDSLPRSEAQPYGKTCREVLERDHYQCRYPGCWTQANLHVHHIVFRSKTGRRSRARSNSPENLLTLCVFHHRMLHSGLIGVKGKAPHRLEWRLPQLMEQALLRSQGEASIGLKSELKRSDGLLEAVAPVEPARVPWPELGSAAL